MEPAPSEKLVATFAGGNKNPKPLTMPASKNSLDETSVLERLKIENSFSNIQNSVSFARRSAAPAIQQLSAKNPAAIKP